MEDGARNDNDVATLRQQCDKLVHLLADVRNAYLRDVVTLKESIGATASVPSLDVRPFFPKHMSTSRTLELPLYAPADWSLLINPCPCKRCAGVVSLIFSGAEQLRKGERAMQYEKEAKEAHKQLRSAEARCRAQYTRAEVAELKLQQAQHDLACRDFDEQGGAWLQRAGAQRQLALHLADAKGQCNAARVDRTRALQKARASAARAAATEAVAKHLERLCQLAKVAEAEAKAHAKVTVDMANARAEAVICGAEARMKTATEALQAKAKLAVDEAEARVREAEHCVAPLKSRVAQAETEVEALRMELSAKAAQCEQQMQACALLETELARSETRREQLSREVEKCRTAAVAHGIQAQRNDRRIDELEKNLANSGEQLSAARARASSIEEEVAILRQTERHVRHELDAALAGRQCEWRKAEQATAERNEALSREQDAIKRLETAERDAAAEADRANAVQRAADDAHARAQQRYDALRADLSVTQAAAATAARDAGEALSACRLQKEYECAEKMRMVRTLCEHEAHAEAAAATQIAWRAADAARHASSRAIDRIMDRTMTIGALNALASRARRKRNAALALAGRKYRAKLAAIGAAAHAARASDAAQHAAREASLVAQHAQSLFQARDRTAEAIRSATEAIERAAEAEDAQDETRTRCVIQCAIDDAVGLTVDKHHEIELCALMKQREAADAAARTAREALAIERKARQNAEARALETEAMAEREASVFSRAVRNGYREQSAMLGIVHAKRWQTAAWAKAAARCDAATQTPPLVCPSSCQFTADDTPAATGLSCAPANTFAGLAVGAAVRGARVRKAQKKKISEKVKAGARIAWRRAPLHELRLANGVATGANVAAVSQPTRSITHSHAKNHQFVQLHTSRRRQHTLAIVDLSAGGESTGRKSVEPVPRREWREFLQPPECS